jgi:preprotein translocase subunit SecY
MWEKLRVIFTIPELRKKILFTLGLLAVYRVGWQIPLPIVDQSQMSAFFKSATGVGQLFQQVAVFSAASLSTITIFGLGIMPYISASIIFQLLGSVWGPLERLQKEGESGRKKINEYTRYATVFLCIGQSWADPRFVPGQRLAALQLASGDGHGHDGRHDLFDVARRADRRVRHRQRHQPDHHGRHFGEHARRRVFAGQ